ncbi:MAG: hypothetical protein ACE5IO_00360, partial [Thermoplasmata archaeon]
ILGMIMWGSGPSRIWFGPYSITTDLLMLLGGFIVSIVPFVAGINTMREGSYRLSLFGAIAGLLSIGFIAGLVLSALALVLILAESKSLSRSTPMKRGVRMSLATASAHLIHIGAALLIIGYATSTFLPSFYGNVNLGAYQRSETMEGYTFDVVGSKGVDSENDGFYEFMEVKVRISRSDDIVESILLKMVWLGSGMGNMGPHYMSEVVVQSEHAVDIYFSVVGFYTASDDWISIKDDTSSMFTTSNVIAIAVDIKFVPLIGLVWSGVWIMSAGIVTRTAFDRWPARRKETAEREGVLRTDLKYEEMLERELQMLENR